MEPGFSCLILALLGSLWLEIQRISLACHGNNYAGWQRPGRVVLPDGGQEVCTGAREGSVLLMP